MSSEHGDGLARSEFLEPTVGPELMDAMRTLKRAADPAGLLNPGKILDAPKMDSKFTLRDKIRSPRSGRPICPLPAAAAWT